MKNFSHLKFLLGIGLLVLLPIIGSCCAAEISFWEEAKLLVMGVAAVLIVKGTADVINAHK